MQQINTFIGYSLKRFFQSEYDSIMLIQNDKYLIEMIGLNIADQSGVPQDDQFSIKADQVSKWFYRLLNEPNIDFEKFEEFKQTFKEDLYVRRFFVMCLQAKRTKAEFELSEDGYKNVLSVLTTILDIVI